MSHSLADDRGRRLVVDIGGGSTECVLGERFDPIRTDSLGMGCVVYSLRFFPDGKVRAEEFRRAEIAARLKLEPIERRYLESGWDSCVGSSGTILAVEALLDVKRRVAPYLDLQLVAFPQDGVLRTKGGFDNLKRALDLGVDVVGGIPHFERTMQDGAASVRLLCELAAELGVPVDMHCDESDDPLSRHVETLACETVRLGLQGRVTGSHLTSMHSMDNYYVSKLINLMAEAQLNVVSNPCVNITLQGRFDNYPKRRGLTRVPELMAAGLTVPQSRAQRTIRSFGARLTWCTVSRS